MATLYFKVSSDWDQVVKLRQECEKLEAQLKKMDVNKSPAAAKALETQLSSARQQMMGLVTEAAKAGAVMEKDFKSKIYTVSQSVNDFTQKIIDQKKVVKDVEYDVKRLGEAYKIALKRNPTGAAGLLSEYQSAKKVLSEEKATLFGLTQQQAEARLSVKRLKDEYSAFKEEAGEATDANEGMSLSLTKVLGVIGGVTALKGFVSDLINVRGQFQQLEIAFSTMLKSKEAADKLMTELVDIAAKTPFDLQGVAQSAKQMIAYGSSAENVGDELVMLGNVAAGVGSQLSEIAYLYGTLRTQGRAYAVDIRQFAGRGIPIYEELAKVLGVTKDEVSGLVKEGKVGFKEVEQAFKNMTSESGIYYNLMQEQSKSLTGQISNLKDAWDSMLNKIGKETQGIASTGISTIKSLIENYETIGKILAGLIITYGTYKAACIAVTAVQALHTAGINALTVAERIHYGWLVLTEKAQKLLNATMLANPYVLLVTSVGALCVGMYNLYSSFDDVNRLSVKLQNEIDNLKDKTEQNNNTIREYLPIAKDAKESTEKREDAINKLKKAYPDYFKSLSIETSKNYDVADAVAASNEEYRKRLVLMEKLARQRYEEAKANYEKNQPKNGNIPSVMGGTTGYSQTSMSTQDLAYVKQLKAAWDTAKDAVKEYSKINSKAKTNRGPSRESSNIDKNNKNTNLGNKQFNSILEHAQKISEIERKQAIERAKEAEELENQVEQARINAMADGSDKTIAQREYDNKKELEAIDRAKEEYIQKEIQRQKEIFDAKEDLRAKQNPKYKKRSFDSSNITVDSSSYDLLKEYTEKSQIQNEVNVQKEALNEYLKNYGTYQQKRLAISQEYSDKINKAQSEGERLSLQASMDDALSKLDFEQIKGNMNWEDVFGNLGDMTISQLERIRQQLRNMLSDGNLGLEEYKTAVEQIDKINTAIVEKNDEVKNTLGLILPMTQRRKEIEMEVAEAERTVNSLMHEMMEMQNSLNQQRESVAGYLQTSGISVGAKDIITSNFDNILSQIGGLFGEDSDIYKNVKKSFDDIAGSERKLTTTTQKLVKAQNDEYGARTKLNNFLTSFGNKLQAISDIMSLINSNIQSLPDLFSQLGVDMSNDFGKGISDLANASQSASNFIKDAMSGNFVGALSNGIGAVKGILSGFNNILGLGIGKGNVEYVTELTEKLTDSNDRLRDSIDRLKDKMDESAGGEAIKNYEQAKDAQEQLNRQTLEILKAQMSYTGAHHSNAYYWGEAIDGNAATSSRIYDSINKSLIEWLKTNPNANYSISSVNSYEDMFKLTPEQMAYIRDYNREIWNEITDIGKYDKSEYWENYAALAGQLENLTEQINENLTQVSFDSLRDSFMNTLLDMDADAQDFADDFGEYMMKSLLNYQLGDVFDEDLKKMV